MIVTSPFSAKDMLLNLLAVAFITEADDMLAMLLSPAERRRPDKALEEMRKSGVVVDGMVFARLVALACMSIVLFVVYAEFFLNALGLGKGCSGMDAALALYAVAWCFLSRSRSLGLALCNDQMQGRPVGVERRAVFGFGGIVLFAAVGIAVEDWSFWHQ